MNKDLNINFFKPVGDFMKKDDVAMKKKLLIIWFVATYGFLFLLKLVADPG